MVKLRWLSLIAGTILACAPASTSAGAGPPNRIVGGSAAEAGEYPHHGFVIVDFDGARSYCGGSLIASRFVVTAAHCVRGTGGATPDAVTVILGQDRIPWGSGTVDETDFPPESRYAATATAHESFDPATRPDHDVAVLHLDRVATLEQLRFPRPGDTASWSPGVTATTIGWGVTESGAPSEALLEVQLPVVSDADCTAAWSSEGADFISAPRMLCAAGDQGRDSCVGDSGGPLLVPDGPRLLLAGLVSFGANPCASGPPGVYTELGDPDLNRWVRARVALAEFDASDDEPEPGEEIIFTATGSTPDGPYDSFAWDVDGDGFDDGTGPVLRHAFPAGQATVSLQATRGGLFPHAEIRRRPFAVRFRSPVAFAATAVSVSEGDVASLAVSKQGGGAGAITVAALDGAGDLDFTPMTLTLLADAPQASAALATIEDTRDEPDETFTVELRGPSGDLLLGAPTRIAVTIVDDDAPRAGLRHSGLRGLVASFSTIAPARVDVAVLQRGTRRVLAVAKARPFGAGTHRARLQLTSTGRRALRRHRRIRATVRYGATVAGSDVVSATRARATLTRGGGR